jgi:transposase InsO family protein
VSKARLVITAVVLEGRSQAEVARSYGLSKAWVSELVSRYRTEGEAAFEARSRRPKTSPSALPMATRKLIYQLRVELSEQGHDAGAQTIAWHLQTRHGIQVAPATIWRHLRAAGLITEQPQKRPRSSFIRFEAAQPNELWQTDFTHYLLADGTDVEILTFLDDHTRKALHLSCHTPVTGPAVVTAFRAATAQHGLPAAVLSDNGLVFTTRFAGGKGRSGFETELARHGIQQRNSRPAHPTTCGKVERFQQTMKNWLRKQTPPDTLAQLQAQLDQFAGYYNTRRPHRALDRRTPDAAYAARPKATPTPTEDPGRHRVREDVVDRDGKLTLRHDGRLHHIGIGRTHARTPVLMLIDDLEIRVIDKRTGELIRELTLDPDRDYQPTGRSGNQKRPNPGVRPFGMS